MNQPEPLVTVIMPIRNEARLIIQSLGAVLAQNYPSIRLEILVADGMSDDGTLEIIRTLPGTERVRIIQNPSKRQADGLNAAIQQARGEYIVRIDGHAVIAPDYVRECVRTLQKTGAANAGGNMDAVGITPTGKAIAAAGKSAFAVPTAFRISDQPQFTDTVYMGAWRRETFDQIGLFNPTATPNEDYELNYRIRKSGDAIYLAPHIRSKYYGRQTFSALARQYYGYGIGKIQTLILHPQSIRPRQLVAPVFVAGLVIGGFLALLHSFFLALWLVGMFAYAAMSLYFSLQQALRFGLGLFWRLPLVFLTIHVSWGSGFWVGLARAVLPNQPRPTP